MKLKLQKICTVMLIASLLLSSLCMISYADEQTAINISSVKAEESNITVEGTLSDSAVKNVSIYVLPTDVGEYTIDSADSFLSAILEWGLFGEFVYASQKLSTAEGFKFAFTVGEPGTYAVLVSCEDAEIPAFAEFRILTFADHLNSLADNYQEFRNVLADNFSKTGATHVNKLLLLSDEYKEKVYDGMFALVEFPDMGVLASSADAQILGVIDGILNELKENPENVDAMLRAMRDMPELFGVTKLSIYDNNLNVDCKNAVKAELSEKIALCTTVEQLGGYFDAEVVRQVMLFESEVVESINLLSNAGDFGKAFEENKEILGLNESEAITLSRLSTAMKERIFADMIAASDTNDDGKAEFVTFREITDAFRTTISGVGNSAVILDIINNIDNKNILTDLLREYSSNFTALNIAGYEALGNSEDATYRKYVRDKFSDGTQDASFNAMTERFNSIVADATELKALLDKINQSNYTNMIVMVMPANLNLMNVSETTKANYQYVYGYSSSEHTNLINNLIKYIPYDTLDDFVRTFDEVAKASYDKLMSNNGSGGSSGSSGGSSGGSFGGRDYVVTGNSSSGTTANLSASFADISSVPWAKEQILSLSEKGIINGVGNGMFAPMDNVTREQFVKLLVEAFGLFDKDADCSFPDVSSDKWFYGYVASGYKSGLVKGNETGLFGSGKFITREDMALLTYRAYVTANGDISVPEDKLLFADDYNVSAYASEAVYALKEKGIINGTGNNLFNPKSTCTRAEAAVIIYNVLNP